MNGLFSGDSFALQLVRADSFVQQETRSLVPAGYEQDQLCSLQHGFILACCAVDRIVSSHYSRAVLVSSGIEAFPAFNHVPSEMNFFLAFKVTIEPLVYDPRDYILSH